MFSIFKEKKYIFDKKKKMKYTLKKVIKKLFDERCVHFLMKCLNVNYKRLFHQCVKIFSLCNLK